MKKFFKSKEAGTITPLPPSDPAASPPSSSFATPRPFDEYQARIASQHIPADSNRPLSLQAPPRSSRSTRDSSDELRHAHTYSPPLRQQQQQQQQRRSQQPANPSPQKNRFPNQIHATQALDTTAYESYSDPTSAHSQPPQPLRPSYDRSNTTDHDARRPQPPPLPIPPQAGTLSSMPAFPPPNSLRPAQPPAAHRRNGSQSMGVASGAAFQSHSQTQNGSVDHYYTHLPPIKPPSSSTHAAWPVPRHRKSDDSHDSQNGAYDDDDDDDDEGQTPTAAGAPRPAAYPVYSGADGDQDAGGEVLISQGRYEETTLRELDSKDKGRGKKLFAFATGSSKDKKAKQDPDRAAASSPIPRASRDRDDARLMSPPMDSRSHSAHERHKEGGWMDRWSKRTHQQQAARMQDKELEEMVASRIGWLSANAYDEHDWMQILPLIDVVSQSEAASKEAARALRKEFKYGSVDTQRRAVRIWALLTLNASDRFRLHIASRRFLDAIEDTVASSKTPLSVKETMLRVLGVLAFEFKGDPELALVTKCWNKVKPSDRPKDGEPLEDDLFEFRLPQPQARAAAGQQQLQQQPGQQPSWRRTTQRYSQQPDGGVSYDEIATHRQSQQQQQHVFSSDLAGQPQRYSGTFAPPPQPPPVPASLQPQTRPPPPRQPQQTQSQQDTWPRPNVPPSDLDPSPRTNAPLQPPPMDHSTTTSGADVISTLEAAAASMDSRSASFRSSSADSFAPNRDLVTLDEDVRRLHEECQIARSNASVLVDTILHEDLHAETAELVDEFHLKVGRSIDVIASQIGWASAQAERSRATVGGGGETREEALLADLLEAHGRASEAMKLVEDARRRLEEEAEERRVTERSLRETRLDRSMLGVEEAYRGRGSAQASGSRSPSPNMAVLSPPSAFSPNGSAPRIARPLPVPRSERSSDSNSTHSYPHPAQNSLTASVTSTHSKGRSPLPQTPQLNTDVNKEQEEEDELQTPVVPSAKALGKRRAVSVRYPTPPVGAQEVPPVPPRGALVNGVAGMRLE